MEAAPFAERRGRFGEAVSAVVPEPKAAPEEPDNNLAQFLALWRSARLCGRRWPVALSCRPDPGERDSWVSRSWT